jgi:hypothetical protein
MPLQKQMVSIPLRLGVDTEESPALVDGSRFLQLGNAVFDKGAAGEIHKRNGYAGMPMIDSQGYAIGQVTTLGVFNQEQLLTGVSANPAVPQQSLYGFGDVDQAWNWRGTLQQITPTERIISNQGTSAQAVDMVSTGGLSAYAWISGAIIFAQLVDEETGGSYSTAIAGSLFGVQGAACRLIVNTSGTTIFLFVLTVAGAISVYSAALASPTSGFALTQANVITGVTAANGFDVCMTANGFAIVTCTIAPGVIEAYSLKQATIGTVDASLAVFSPAGEVTGKTCVASEGATKAMVGAVVKTGVGAWQIQTKFLTVGSGSLTAGSAVIVQDANTGTHFIAAPPRLACCQVGSATEQVLAYEIAGVANSQTAGSFQIYTTQPQTGWAIITEAGSLSNRTLGFTTNLASAPFIQGGFPYVFQVYPSQTQQELVLQRPLPAGANKTTLQVLGKYMVGDAGPAISVNALPRPQALSSGNWALGTLEGTELISVLGQPETVYGVAELALNFTTTPGGLPGRVPNAQLGGNAIFAAGSQVYGYDGQMVSELGFNVYPESPVVTFQTSQVSVVLDVLDPLLNIKTALSIYIPDNAVSPGGAIGKLITPGEYFVFNAYSGGLLGAVCFYFTVDGVGSAPSGAAWSGVTMVQIPIASTSTAIAVATIAEYTLATGLSTAGGDWTVAYTSTGAGTGTYSPQRITCVLAAPAIAASIPTMNRAFSAWQIQAGAGGLETVFGVSCCPASLISGGQYFLFSVLDTTPCIGYVWFKVAGVGTDPAPLTGSPISPLTYVGPVPVVLAGNETEVQVATAISAALSSAYFMGDSTVTQTGNQIVVNSTINGNIPVPGYATNPANVGVAQGYCGTVVDGVSGYEAQEFVAVYEKWDAAGQLHQSAPSVPTVVAVPVYVAAGGGIIPAQAPVPPSAVFTVGVQNLFLTQKEFLGGLVSLAIYQTQSDQSLFYRITNPTAPLLNAEASLFNTTFTANQPDSPSAPVGSTAKAITGLSSNAPLYTTGGIYENDTPPAASIVCNSQDRVFLGGEELGNNVSYSKPFLYGQGIAFSGQQIITLNSNIGTTACGALVGIRVMDGNTIFFQQNAVQFISGSGPTITGSGQAFSQAQLVASSTVVGCRDPGSIALTPGGLIFKSNQGWYLLNRSLQLVPIGKKVQAFNSDVCTSAVCVPNSTQVRCICGATGTTLLYDWFYDDWGPFTPHNGWDACIGPGGAYTYVNSATGVVQSETQGIYADTTAGGGFPMAAQTAWLKLNGISGFGAVWKVFLKGLFLGSQPYQIQIAYDYNPKIVDTFVFQLGASNGVWGGDSSPWGSGNVWGGGQAVLYPDSYEIRIYPSRVHCTALQITVTEEPPYSTTRTWSLDAIDLEVGIRKGGRKVGITRSIG